MKLAGKQYIVYPSRSDKITLLGIGDIHYGHRGCNQKLLDRDLARVENDPNTFFVLLGDHAEYISHRDKRFEPDCFDEDIKIKDLGRLGKHYSNWTINKFKHVSHKCLGAIWGNHEGKYQQFYEQGNLHQETCDGLKVPNLEFLCLLDLVFVRSNQFKQPTLLRSYENLEKAKAGNSWQVRKLITHGSGGAISTPSKVKKGLDLVDKYEADVYMMGHVHHMQPAKKVKITANPACTKVCKKVSLVTICGGYLETYLEGTTSYGEEKLYGASQLGASVIHYDPELKEYKSEI